MNAKTNILIKRAVDIAMYLLFLVLMGECVLRGAVHEWLGMAVGTLFVVHNLLNRNWYKALFKGRYSAARKVQTAVNFMLIIAVSACMISGVLMSRHIFTVESGSAIDFGRRLHLVATAWAFVLITVHLALHRKIFASACNKLFAKLKSGRHVRIACRILAAAFCLYGLYLFIDRRFWEELFYMIDYQKEYDYSQSMPAYLAGTAALSAFFAAATSCAEKLLTGRKK